MNVRASIHHARRACWLEYTDLVHVLTTPDPAGAPELIAAAERAARDGLHAVGFVTYEAAPGFDGKHTAHPPGRLPAAWFGLFAGVRTVGEPTGPGGPDGLPSWRPTVDAAAYRQQIATVRRYIGAGDSYQVNLSYRLRASVPNVPGAGARLFEAMIARQPGGYGALLETDDWALCCASHELFFERRGRRLTSRPMKGTAPRGQTPADDAERARWLSRSLKNRAENLMITDMVRNDLGRLADPGSVRADRLFQLEPYPTLWQMTSTVTAESDASLAEIFRALFPAASITGAPKRRTMEIIHELESDPREIYTGTIGIVEPGGDAQFNVAIRTAWIDKRRGAAEYGVGGGIVWDSDPDEEYEETRTKSRILTPAPASRPLTAGSGGRSAVLEDRHSLLETLRLERPGGYFLLERHLRRLRAAAGFFGRPLFEDELRSNLAHLARALPSGVWRIRLLVDAAGRATIEHAPLDPAGRPHTVILADRPEPVLDNPFVSHKTTERSLYDRARAAARAQAHKAGAHEAGAPEVGAPEAGAPEAGDVLIVNERGEVTEATIANLVVDLDGCLVTPPCSSGLLGGVYRQHLLEAGLVTERALRPEDVRSARTLYLVNALRGMWRVTLL